MTPVFQVVQPGVLATIQDLGRFGWQRFGVGTAGAMDRFALEVGNLLVGNPRGMAGLEIGLGGLKLQCLEDRVVAVCGVEMSAGLPLWKSFRVRKGEELFFRSAARGVWAYLTVAGGFEAETLMGSSSVSVREKIGRPAAPGDVLQAGARAPSGGEGRALAPEDIPKYGSEVEVRVVLGPEEESFLEESLGIFLSTPFEVTSQSNRMGYRLRGPAIRHKAGADILSDAVSPGTVQVPADGQPIVLMAERQTTGGYARIGTVISVDLPTMAQAPPGSRVSFHPVGVDEAQDLAVRRERFLAALEADWAR